MPSAADGRHVLAYAPLLLSNCRFPFELTLAVVKMPSYSCTGNGRAIAVVQSSHEFPMSAVPKMIG